MKKINIFLSAAVIFSLLLGGCGKTGVTYTQREAKSSDGEVWSVFLYMCGGTVDEDRVYEVLDSLMEVDYTQNVRFFTEIGGKNEWSRDGLYNDYSQRFIMQKDSMFLAKQSASTNICTDDELTDFLKWGIDTYPADRYGLIIWGESSGIQNGVGIDEQNNFDSLSFEEIYYSLSQCNEHIDFVGFDASYMSNLEMATMLAPYADYLIGTEETIMPCGWDYKRLAEYLIDNPEAETTEIGKDICDGYYEKCGELSNAAQMSVVDLSRVTELLQQFDGMEGMMDISADNVEYFANMMRKLRFVEGCGARSKFENYTDMVDLGNLAETIQADIGSAADTLIDILSKTVTYNVCGKLRPYMKGIGVYYPFSGTAQSIENYCKVFRSHNCLTFARKISSNAQTVLGAGEEDYNSTNAYADYLARRGSFGMIAATDGDGYRLNVDTDPMMIKEVGLNVYRYDDKTGKYLKLGTDYNADGELGVSSSFNMLFPTKCLSINGHNVMSLRIEKGFEYDIYSVPVLLNGERANIRIAHNLSSDNYEITGVWSGIDPASSMDLRDFRKLKRGDKITPLFESYGEEEAFEGKSFRIGITGAKAEMKKIKGQPVYEYCAEDIYGNVYTADLYAK